MKVIYDDRYRRKGFSLLWNLSAIKNFGGYKDVLTLRQFLAFIQKVNSNQEIEFEEKPLVVGLEGVLDVLPFDDAERWLGEVLKPAILTYQEFYEGERSLILWIPSGNGRIVESPALGHYLWKLNGRSLEIGRILWGGSDDGLFQLHSKNENNQQEWIGLHHTRIS
jgi:hypothetical protein